jgi:hypothetical protein
MRPDPGPSASGPHADRGAKVVDLDFHLLEALLIVSAPGASSRAANATS